MRFPKVRLTIGRLMIGIAVIALGAAYPGIAIVCLMFLGTLTTYVILLLALIALVALLGAPGILVLRALEQSRRVRPVGADAPSR